MYKKIQYRPLKYYVPDDYFSYIFTNSSSNYSGLKHTVQVKVYEKYTYKYYKIVNKFINI